MCGSGTPPEYAVEARITTAWGYHRQGYCQAGFSAVLTPDNRRLFLGAVGSWYWQGQVFVQDLFSQSDLIATDEGPANDDDSYLGYSSAIGEFSGDEELDVVIGMPRGSNLTGKIVLFNLKLVNLHNITGEQMGSYFGYSVCVVDVNGDKLDDIIVGAPFYSDLKSRDSSYETGRVYIIYQDATHHFKRRHLLNGRESRGRFGLSLSSAGDINRDGFGDFVVGAPYGGSNARGAVYIFHGSKKGVKSRVSQVIFAEDLDSNLSTFGFSLSGGLDMDMNEYPDLLIGAYAAHKAFLLKSRSVVSVTASLTVNPEKINLDEKGCSLLDGTLVSCVVIHLCLEFSGVGVNSKLEFEFVTRLDVLKTSGPRVFFLASEQDHVQNSTATLQKESIYCKSIFIYIKSAVKDKLMPIVVEVNYSLVSERSKINELKPMLDQSISSKLKKEISIQKDCGKDNICIPDLQINCESNFATFVMGSRERLEILVNITNVGEDAFETNFYVEIPAGVDFINVDQGSIDLSVSCRSISPTSNNYQCDAGNPLKANKTVTFTILLSPKYLNSTNNEYEFSMHVNSTNPENVTTEFNNFWLHRIPVKFEVDLIISGISIPDIVLYNKTTLPLDLITHEDEVGPEIIHLYNIFNRGPSPIIEAEIFILWPTYTLANQDLLYLIDQPEASSFGRCEFVPNVNYLNLTVDKSIPPLSQSSLSVVNMDDSIPNESENSSLHYQTNERSKRDVDARSRLWTSSLNSLGFDELKITSKLITRVTALPYSVQTRSFEPEVYVVETVITPSDVASGRKQVPWWIIGAAVSAGIFLLLILVIFLWKFGFFQRKRPHDEDDHFPLKNCMTTFFHLHQVADIPKPEILLQIKLRANDRTEDNMKNSEKDTLLRPSEAVSGSRRGDVKSSGHMVERTLASGGAGSNTVCPHVITSSLCQYTGVLRFKCIDTSRLEPGHRDQDQDIATRTSPLFMSQDRFLKFH
uniref:Uncharacterized protein n=1 Tax=Strigamia maritima TaxID=126957 RepID=T1JAL2_STRMM